jgi:hypothetical protein
VRFFGDSFFSGAISRQLRFDGFSFVGEVSPYFAAREDSLWAILELPKARTLWHALAPQVPGESR